VDLLHLGELGDADAISPTSTISPCAAPSQIVFRLEDRIALDTFPEPAYDQVDVKQVFPRLGAVLLRLPYRCEFCDIPRSTAAIRLKTPEQICRELDAIVPAAPGRGRPSTTISSATRSGP
jgi:hypothetical protein